MAGDGYLAAGVVQVLRVDLIKIDGGTQSRAGIDTDTVDDYADAMREGIEFPPVIVYFDGVHYWLADGFHRYLARKKAELLSLSVEVRTGTKRDAILYSAGANATHGLKRSNEDKRAAVHLLLADEEWSKATDRWIASKCAVGYNLVTKVRIELGMPLDEPRVARDGTVRGPSKATLKAIENRKQNEIQRPDAQPVGGEQDDDIDDDLDASTEDDWLGNDDDPVGAGLKEAKEFDRLIRQITSVHGEAKKLAEGYGGAFLDDHKLAELKAKLTNAAQVLRDTRPHCECGYCGGEGGACRECRGGGYLTKLKAADMPQPEAAAV